MKKTILLALALVVLAASPAAAALNEYYTYGGFTPVTMAFENMARVFGDASYKGAIGALVVLGLFAGGVGGYLKMLGGQGGPLSWLVPFIIGMTLYLGFFVPKINLAVYDPVYNQNKVIAGVPSGVAYFAGTVNRLELFVIETFDTNAELPPATACGTMEPMQYQTAGGAVGMRLMRGAADQYVESSEASQTLNNYINDCVVFELNRPGTTLTIDKILAPGCGKTTLDVIGAANNPANYTTSYFGSSTGVTCTCDVAYDSLTLYYSNPLNANQPGNNACAGTGFSDKARCQEILVNMLNASNGDSFDSTQFISNNSIAKITSDALISGGGAATTAYMTQLNQAQSGSSSGFMAGIMNPYMIDAYVSYTFMLMPILALFLVTPLWKNAFGLILSMIVWTCLLRCLDVITFHSWAAQYQMAMASAMENTGMGLEAAMRLPTTSNQYLGTFASMRNSVFLLATAVSGALFKFGDSAMSRLADKATQDHDGVKGAISDRGTAAKMAMDTVAGASRASMMTALASGAHGWDNVGKGIATNELASAAAGAGMASAYGGNVNSMMSGQKQVSAINTTQSSARAGALTEAHARGAGVNDAATMKGVLEAMGTDGKTAGWQAKLLTEKNLGESKGFEAAHKEAQKGGYKGGITQFAADMAKVSTEKGFADSQGWKDFVQEKFHGNEQAALQAATNVAAFQLGKHTGEVEQTMAGTGLTATGSGGASGKVTGDNNLYGIASDSVRRGIAEDNAGEKIKSDPRLYNKEGFTEAGKGKLAEQTETQKAEKAAQLAQEKARLDGTGLNHNDKAKALHKKEAEIDAKQTAERSALENKLKADPTMHQKAGLTEEGYKAFMGQIAGANQQSFTDREKAYGATDKKVQTDGNGNVVRTDEKGAVHDKKAMHALAKELRAGGLKHAAKELDAMAAKGKGFNFELSRDKTGHITNFNASGGATATLNDKARQDIGRLNEYTNLNKSTVGSQQWSGKSKVQELTDKKVIDQGLRETIGNRSDKGDRLANFTEKKVATVGGGMETGYYYKAKNGTEFLVSGQQDGLLHQKIQKDGKAVDIMVDPRSGAVLLEKGESGKKEVIYANRSEYQGGTGVTGAFNSAVSSKVASVTGWDEKTVQMAVGTIEDVTNSVLPAASAVSGARASHKAAKVEAAKTGGPDPGLRATAKRAAHKIAEIPGKVADRINPSRVQQRAQQQNAGMGPLGTSGGAPAASPAAHVATPANTPRPNMSGINNSAPSVSNNGGYGNLTTRRPAGGASPTTKPTSGAPKAVRPKSN